MFFFVFLPFFFFWLLIFFNLVFILCVYGDLDMIIYFNFFIWLSRYQKNNPISSWYKKNIIASRYGLFLKNFS